MRFIRHLKITQTLRLAEANVLFKLHMNIYLVLYPQACRVHYALLLKFRLDFMQQKKTCIGHSMTIIKVSDEICIFLQLLFNFGCRTRCDLFAKCIAFPLINFT